MWGTFCFFVAALIFIIASLDSWKWEDFEPTTLGLFFVAVGLIIDPVVGFVRSRNA